MMMMMTFITRMGEGQGRTKKERKATKSKGSGLEEGASRALRHRYSSILHLAQGYHSASEQGTKVCRGGLVTQGLTTWLEVG